MKSLILITTLFSFSAFSSVSLTTLHDSLDQAIISLEDDSCSETLDNLNNAYFSVGQIEGAIEVIKQLQPDTDVSEEERQVAEAKVQLAEISNQYKSICVK